MSPRPMRTYRADLITCERCGRHVGGRWAEARMVESAVFCVTCAPAPSAAHHGLEGVAGSAGSSERVPAHRTAEARLSGR